jgi:hypothetical protein
MQSEVEKRFSESYEYRKKYSELVAFLHTEIGQLNEVVQVWPYQDLAEREHVRKALASEPNWPPNIQEFIIHATSEIVTPFEFVPPFQPGTYGPYYELREYNYRPSLESQLTQDWEARLPARMKYSPVMLAGTTELGNVNKLVHLWPYKSLDERMAIRTQTVTDGVWPPSVRDDIHFEQRTRILMPASFSPSL